MTEERIGIDARTRIGVIGANTLLLTASFVGVSLQTGYPTRQQCRSGGDAHSCLQLAALGLTTVESPEARKTRYR